MTFVTPGWIVTASVWPVLFVLSFAGAISSGLFLVLVLIAAYRRRRLASAMASSVACVPEKSLPFVTVLKPVHGMEPRLTENIESFFRQEYPDFEIVFGARSADNPALRVVEEIRARYPLVKCRVVISGQPSWPNAKTFSLDRITADSSSEYFVITDSDVAVAPDFLRNVVPPLLNPKVGLVTCLYRGVPAGGMWSLLEALGMSVEMSSGVIVADLLEGMRFALGPGMAIRQDVLAKIGGFVSAKDYYSDDFVLGNLVWTAGYQVALSHHIVEHVLIPQSFLRTFGHQLRWHKSTRYSRPKGHLGTGLTFAMPFGILGMASATALGHPRLGFVLLALAFANRIVQSIVVGWGVIRDPGILQYWWLYPVRDLFGFATWVGSYTSRRFFWRGEMYHFGEGGLIIPQDRVAESLPAEPFLTTSESERVLVPRPRAAQHPNLSTEVLSAPPDSSIL
jgi:ceramide glucosyltransferase